MRIKDVTISGFHKITNDNKRIVPMDNCNIIVGNNGAGKTTIMQAIQWALLGYIPGTNKTKGEIFKHANSNDMSVQVTFDGGDTESINRRLFQTDPNFDVVSESNVSDTFNVLGDLELPILNYDEFMGLSANKLKEWFTNILPEHVVNIDWDSELYSVIPEHLQSEEIEEFKSSLFEMIQFEVDKDKPTSIEDIKAVNIAIKEHLKLYKAELSQLESTIKTLVFYSDISSELDIIELQEKIKQLESDIVEAEKAQATIKNNAELQAQIDNLHCENIEELKSEVKALSDKLDGIRKEGIELKDKSTILKAKMDPMQKIVESKGVCPYTDNICSTIESDIKQFQSDLDDMQKELEDVEKSTELKRKEYSDVQNELSLKQSELNAATTAEQKIRELSNQIVSVASNKISMLPELTSELEDAKNNLIKLEANQKYEKSIDEFNIQKQQYSYKIEVFKLWDKLTDVNGLQSKLLIEGDQFDELSRTMNDIGILSDVVKFDVGGKNKFAFGIIRDDKFIRYNQLSSGEKCMYSITLLFALLKLSDVPLKLVMIDDMLDHLDTNNLSKVVNYIANNQDIQVIFAGVFNNADIPTDKVNLIEVE